MGLGHLGLDRRRSVVPRGESLVGAAESVRLVVRQHEAAVGQPHAPGRGCRSGSPAVGCPRAPGRGAGRHRRRPDRPAPSARRAAVAISVTRRSSSRPAFASSPPTRGSSNPSSSSRWPRATSRSRRPAAGPERRLDDSAETPHDVLAAAQVDVVVRQLVAHGRVHLGEEVGRLERDPFHDAVDQCADERAAGHRGQRQASPSGVGSSSLSSGGALRREPGAGRRTSPRPGSAQPPTHWR